MGCVKLLHVYCTICVQNSMFPQVYDGLNEDLTRLADKVAKKRLVVF